MDNDIKNLRTYEEDIKNALDEGGVTTTQIVLAEQKKKLKPQPIQISPEQKEGRAKIVKNILVTIVLLGLAGGIFYAVTKYILPARNSGRIETQIAQVDFITIDKNVYVETNGKIFSEVLSRIKSELSRHGGYNEDELAEINVIKTVSETDSAGVKNEFKQKIAPSDFFTLIDSRAPDTLIRAFGKKILIGGHKKENLEPFILFEVSDSQQAFAGMLNWEPNLIRDVQDLFEIVTDRNEIEGTLPRIPTPPQNVATATPPATTTTATTSTSTESTPVEPEEIQIPKPTYDQKKFIDVVLLNKDARAIKNSDNEIIFFYSFIDKQNLILTTNIETLRKVTSGLKTANLIR